MNSSCWHPWELKSLQLSWPRDWLDRDERLPALGCVSRIKSCLCLLVTLTRKVSSGGGAAKGCVSLFLPNILRYLNWKGHIINAAVGAAKRKKKLIGGWATRCFEMGHECFCVEDILGSLVIISSPQALEWSLGSSEIKSLLFSLKTIEFTSLYMFRLQIPMNYLWRSCWICGTTLALASKGSKPSVRKFLWKMDYYCYYFHGICNSVMLGECWVGRLDVCVGCFTSGNYQLCIRRPSVWTHLTRKYIWGLPIALYGCFK